MILDKTDKTVKFRPDWPKGVTKLTVYDTIYDTTVGNTFRGLFTMGPHCSMTRAALLKPMGPKVSIISETGHKSVSGGDVARIVTVR